MSKVINFIIVVWLFNCLVFVVKFWNGFIGIFNLCFSSLFILGVREFVIIVSDIMIKVVLFLLKDNIIWIS